jgi:hypothetical protein
MSEIFYECDHSPGTQNKEIDLVCGTCLRDLVNLHNKLLDFVIELSKPFPDRDDYREFIREEAEKLLKDIGYN